jgi:hypothetical protein
MQIREGPVTKRVLHRGFQRSRLADRAALMLLVSLLAILVVSIAHGVRTL